ncbi:twin-arginine translocase subunit TatC [Aurantibacillus circumpalustris]|uniref:twin-arginine translocase subunit TatC n=1 Tax=Aurantibacillus circumpalustris TaxID=3036359 RepID=UPI00295C08BF|nr:twin-arginine translocase subunit TatC [Aurantibacillus circumpalustris]
MAFFASSKNPETGAEMSFLQHLEELRWHLVRSAAVVVAFGIAAFCLNDFIFDTVIFGPLKQDFISYQTLCSLGHKIGAGDVMCIIVRPAHLQTLSASEQFFNHMWISLMCGLILGFPVVLWELWKFIRPALKNQEVGPVKIFVVIASFLFLIGVFFGYFLLFPMSYNFLVNYQVSSSGIVQTQNTFDDYVSLISTMVLVSGIIFEMPVLVYFLTRMTLLTPQFMRKYRKHAVVIILIVAAVITPSPDVTSQMVVAIPMYLLYELSVFVSAWVIKKHKLNV